MFNMLREGWFHSEEEIYLQTLNNPFHLWFSKIWSFGFQHMENHCKLTGVSYITASS